MNLQKKEYNEGYDRTEFYSIMGKFFAEKKYRDEMPYLINTEEKEWRLFSPPSISTDPIPSHTVIFSARPTALYIGARSSAEQAQMLSDICRERNIPCYKMIQNYLGDDFKLFSIPYDEYQKNALQIDKESCAFKCEKG